jgi:tetratricopeptide (TPR) repeat protein
MKSIYALLFLCLFSFCKSPEPKQIDLDELTISQIHQAFSDGEYSAEELVQAYLDRIDSLDSSLNSISFFNPEAVAIAKKLDEEYSKTGKLRPLHGIPLIVKDNINTIGLPTTAGSLALADFYPEENAFIIKKLVEAGAIIIAKSNMAEWAFSPMHSESSTEGTTRNPYNLDHLPAGSSGGTGASIAANFGTIGLGTDTGNSIRGPSSHNALVGFRTTLFIYLTFASGVDAQSLQSLQDELQVLSQNSTYEKDTAYLKKANELGFLLAETNPDSAFTFLDNQIELCRKAGFKEGESNALKIYGNALQNKGDFTGSLSYYEQALKIAESLSSKELVPGILNNIGLVNYNLGNYAEALSQFYEAIKGSENTGNLYVKAAALNNIASIYFEQEKLEEAKTKYREMLEIYSKLGNQGRMILAYNNIGDVELKQNRPLEALENLMIGHRSALELQSPEFIEMTARTLAGIYAALDSTEKAEGYYRQSIEIAREKGYGVPYSHSLIGLADLYFSQENYQEALALANEGLVQAQQMGQPMQLRNANQLLAKILEKEGDFEGALENYKLFKQYSDSINNT